MLAKYLLCIYRVHGSVAWPEDSQGKMMVLVFLTFLHTGNADITPIVVIECGPY